MKQLLRILAMVLVCAAVGAGTASAQISTRMDFSTKFAFTVGHEVMPAGHYSVERVDSTGAVMMLTSGNRSVMLPVMNAELAPNQRADSHLVFVLQGKRYALSQIWSASERTTGVQVVGVPAPHVNAVVVSVHTVRPVVKPRVKR